MGRAVLAGLCVVLAGGAAAAQGLSPLTPSRPAFGGPSGIVPSAPPVITGASSDILRHRDPAGRPCLMVEGMARAHTLNSHLFDHVIAATNGCAQPIKVQICYFKSQDCVAMEVPGRTRKSRILGMLPAVKDFQFEFHERF